MRHLFASLTSRLVLTVVALVVLVAVLIGVAATAGAQRQLTHQVDDQLAPDDPGALADPAAARPGATPRSRDRIASSGCPRRADTRPSSAAPLGRPWARARRRTLDDDVLDVARRRARRRRDPRGRPAGARRLPRDGGRGQRQRRSRSRDRRCPPSRSRRPCTSLIGWEALLIALGALLAAGGGLLLVRRQLRPLTEVAATAHAVAALPLAEGDIDLTERVPDHLTDERTEVGQVGAALNTLLAHVETSLEARHRSEQQVRQFVARRLARAAHPADHHRRLHRAGPPPPRRRQRPHRARQGRGGVRRG